MSVRFSPPGLLQYRVWLLSLFLCLSFRAQPMTHASVSSDYDQWKLLSTQTLKTMANGFIDRELPDSAMVCYTIIANNPSSPSRPEEYLEAATAKMNIGYLYSSYYYDFHEAFDCFSQALKMAENVGDDDLKATCYVNLGALYSTYHQMLDDPSMAAEALEMYRRAYNTSKNTDSRRSMLTAIYNMAVVCLDKDDTSSIRAELDDFLSINPDGKSERWKRISWFIKGLTAMVEGRHAVAEQCLNESLKYSDPNGIPLKNRTVTLLAIAINNKRAGHLQAAASSCHDILKVADDNGFMDISSLTLQTLGAIYKELGDTAGMNTYRLKYFDFKENLVNLSKIKDVKSLSFLDELNAKNEEVARLSAQKNRQSTLLGIILVILIVAAVALWCIVIYSRRLKRRNLELYDRLQSSIRAHKTSAAQEDADSPVPQSQAAPIQIQDNEPKYRSNNLSESEKDDILRRIRNFMETSQEIYQPDFSLERLVDHLDINRSYLSQVVNETGGTNFRSLLNSYRIREACRRLEDASLTGSQTIEAVGQSVGFMSRRNFGIAFKKETGLSPSAFMKIHQEKQNDTIKS
jgi:AraC-like DNA-binding protein